MRILGISELVFSKIRVLLNTSTYLLLLIQLIPLTLMIQPKQFTPRRRHSRLRKRLSALPIAPLLLIFVPNAKIVDLAPPIILCDFADESFEN